MHCRTPPQRRSGGLDCHAETSSAPTWGMHFTLDTSQHRSSFSVVRALSPSASKHQNDDMGGVQVSCSLQGSSVAGSKHESVCQLPGPVQAIATQSNDSLLQIDPTSQPCAGLPPKMGLQMISHRQAADEPRGGPANPTRNIHHTQQG